MEASSLLMANDDRTMPYFTIFSAVVVPSL